MNAPLADFLLADFLGLGLLQWFLVLVLIGLVVFYFRIRGKQ